MTRQVIRAFGWKRSVVSGGILLVMILAGVFATWRHGFGANPVARAAESTGVDASGLRSGAFLSMQRDERGGPILEVQLDAMLKQLGSGVVLERPALLQLLQGVVGEDPEIESRPVADVLARVRLVRVTSSGLSLTIGRRVIVRALSHLIGADDTLQQMTVGEVLDGIAGARLTPQGIAGLLDQDVVTSLLGRDLDAAQRPIPVRDPLFLRRQTVQRRWALVTDLVSDLRRNRSVGAVQDVPHYAKDPRRRSAKAESDALYNEGHDWLVAQQQQACIPLLDGYLRLEEELAAVQAGTTTRAERIPLRWQARRTVFGEPMATLIFGRDEAMERYEVDRLALEADETVSAADKAQRLRARREALKVELAAQGSYVSFPDEAGPGERVAAGERRAR
jgi:hypothetical protein